jgi:transcriptional regulator with XRE-family HTH domain
MYIGDRLRELREAKKLSQGDIEQRTGLLRCYVSRVENGHTIPAIETLEKFARALEVPLYILMYDGDKPPLIDSGPSPKAGPAGKRGTEGKQERYFRKLTRVLAKLSEDDRKLILMMAGHMAK